MPACWRSLVRNGLVMPGFGGVDAVEPLPLNQRLNRKNLHNKDKNFVPNRCHQ